jgi:hypothetical protein
LLGCSLALAQVPDCSRFLTNPVFTKTTTEASGATKESFRLLQCAASWKSASDAQSAGVSATIPVYGIPVPISANWSDAKVEQWKNENCSAEERKSNSNFRYFQTVNAIDPITAKTALACYEAQFKAQADQRSALRCRITDTPSSVVFEAEWARTPGESANPPLVESFFTEGTTCQGSLAAGTPVPEGGRALMCSTPTAAAAAFSLNTSRGSCTLASQTRYPKITLASMTLTQPFFVSGTEVEFPAGFKMVTNGYPATIRADRLTIAGSSSIVSFDARDMGVNQQGRAAGTLLIAAKEVRGSGLTILNAGEPGGVGASGSQGPSGGPGAPGKGRSPVQGSCGPLSFICDNVPLSCTGGENGKQGGPGGPGSKGSTGAPGGGAGAVTLEIPFQSQDSIKVFINTALSGKELGCGGKICGGVGGIGGIGGMGGPGGQGGAGGPGTLTCGGTDGGGIGPRGPQGPQGDSGSDGSAADVRVL